MLKDFNSFLNYKRFGHRIVKILVRWVAYMNFPSAITKNILKICCPVFILQRFESYTLDLFDIMSEQMVIETCHVKHTQIQIHKIQDWHGANSYFGATMATANWLCSSIFFLFRWKRAQHLTVTWAKSLQSDAYMFGIWKRIKGSRQFPL